MFSLKDEIAFVTGAGSGIGQGIAIGLAEAGADVALFDIPASKGLEDTARAVKEKGRRALIVTGDVVDAAALTAAVEKTEQAPGPADARGQQRRHRQRHAGRGDAARAVAADDGRQSDGRLSVLSGGGPGDAARGSAARSSISPRCPDRSSIAA